MHFLDTNAILNLPIKHYIFKEKFIISSETLKELENIKVSQNKTEELRYKARQATRFLDTNGDLYHVIITNKYHHELLDDFDLPVTPDNLIMSCAYDYNINNEEIEFVSFDLLCRNIAKNIFKLNIKVIQDDNEEEYLGYKDVILNDEQMAYLYSNIDFNGFGCLVNEYLVVKNTNNEVVDKLKWDGETFVSLKYRQVNNSFSGKIKPRNLEQELAFDLLQDETIEIKLLLGRFGSGKTILSISNAIQLIRNKKYDKIMWVRNNIEVKNSKEIGALPGSKIEKLLPFAAPLCDHVGGQYGLEMFINSGEIEIEHLGFLRGRDIRNTIIICSEVENMTKEHIQLLIGRIGEGSVLWLDGDLKQIDSKIFEENNGVTILIDKLKNNKHFGYVKLKKTERSEAADLADLLDWYVFVEDLNIITIRGVNFVKWKTILLCEWEAWDITF